MSDRNPGGDTQDRRQRAIDEYDYDSDYSASRSDMIDEAPLVALAAGIAVGAMVAALLPVSQSERRLARPVGQRVSTAARGAVDAARRTGSEKLRELGLSPDAVAEKVTEAGRATAEAAMGAVRNESGKR
jgi:hypothetical protein